MPRPRVLVDLLSYTGTKGGMETYTRELYRLFGEMDTGLEFVGLASKEGSAARPVVVPRRADPVADQRREPLRVGGRRARRHQLASPAAVAPTCSTPRRRSAR